MIYYCIMEDEIVLWIVLDHDKDDEIIAAITTRLIEYPQGNSMAMDWIGGNKNERMVAYGAKSISSYAKDHKCKYLEGYGRKVGIVGLESTGGSQTISPIKWS